MRAFLSLLLLVSNFAFAGVYEDRLKQAKADQWENYKAQYFDRLYRSNLRDLAVIKRFTAARRGLAQDGECVVKAIYCQDNDKLCYNGREQKMALSAFDPAGRYAISGCSLVFNDGLACSVFSDVVKDNWGAECLDETRRAKNFDLRGSARR